MKSLYILILGLCIQSQYIVSSNQYARLNDNKENQESSTPCCQRPISRCALGTIALTTLGSFFLVVWATTPKPKPDFQFPIPEGPVGHCNYMGFSDPEGYHFDRSISPTCNVLNATSPGMDGCPSRIELKWGTFNSSVCESLKNQHCFTDKQMEKIVPAFCKYYYGDKDSNKSSKYAGKKMTSAERRQRQRVMARKFR